MSAWGNWRDINYIVFKIKRKLYIALFSPLSRRKILAEALGHVKFRMEVYHKHTSALCRESTITIMSQCKTLFHVTVAYTGCCTGSMGA